MMTDSELLHYARQILLSDVDVNGQERLKQSHVVVLGLGGLGSPLSLYLGAAGVGRLTLVDGDIVDETNLHRQVIHSQKSLNQLKVESARERILGINPWIQIDALVCMQIIKTWMMRSPAPSVLPIVPIDLLLGF